MAEPPTRLRVVRITAEGDRAHYQQQLKADESMVFADAKTIVYFTQEERVYRLRCVEAWSMVIPWLGFSLSDLLKRVEPTSQAKYVAFETLNDPEQMPGLRSRVLSWPYVEGLRLDEALHPLTMLAVEFFDPRLIWDTASSREVRHA